MKAFVERKEKKSPIVQWNNYGQWQKILLIFFDVQKHSWKRLSKEKKKNRLLYNGIIMNNDKKSFWFSLKKILQSKPIEGCRGKNRVEN